MAENMGDDDSIYNLLDGLSKSDFKRFKPYLRSQTLSVPGFKPIPWRLLEKAEVSDIVQLMRECYGVEGRMTITQHILNALGRWDLAQQLQQDFSTGAINPTVSGAGSGLTQGIHTLGLGSSKAVNRLSSAATSSTPISSKNTSTTWRRKWIQRSQRWCEQMEALANMEDSKVREVGDLMFVHNDKKFQIAIGQTEVLLGLKKDGMEVGIKKMLISNYDDFQNELKRLEQYKFHSHTVQCVHSEDDGDIGYIAMQLCDYNLEEYIKQQPAEHEKKRIVKEFLEGLKDFHEHPEVKLIHGDIKPQNILIDGDGGVRFADLGISHILKPGQTTRVAVRAGTECWEATEVLRNRKGDQDVSSNQSTDIQVAGMLVYYILSGGKHPFGDGIECPLNIFQGDYELNDLNDEEAKDLVKSMLNLDPKARPPITEVLSHPYFWDESRKKSFLKGVGNVPEVQKYRESCKDESLKKVLKELEVDKKSFSTWKTHLDHVTDEDIKKKWFIIVHLMAKDDNIFPETLLSLLRFLRNHWKHQQDMMKEINVMKLFPDLVVTAYKLDKKRNWNGPGSGLTQGIHTLGLGNSKAGYRLSSASTSSTPIPSSNTSTTGRRKWIQRSQRWREQMEALANMEDSKMREVGDLMFVHNDKKFQIAWRGQTDVFLGLKKDGTEVSIKKMLISNYDDFQNELKRLEEYKFHSHTVQCVHSEDDGDIGYIAMQLCDYNLEEYIKQQPAEYEKKRIVKEFLEGLKDFHEHPEVKLIHGDIKPQNILIDGDGGVRFADLGISHILKPGQTTRVTGRAGTECWKATEVLKAQGHKDIRYNQSTDIQVAGMLVYYILSDGKHPFGDGIECPVKISKGDYELNDLNDEEAKDLVKSMLNLDPKARPTITEVLSHPYFWDERRKKSFLKEVGNVPEVQKYRESYKDESLKKVLKELEVDKKSFSMWRTQLDHVTDEDIKKKWFNIVQIMANDDNIFPETLLSLLRFLRNHWKHQQDVMKEINVMKLFPDLVVTAYKLDKKRDWTGAGSGLTQEIHTLGLGSLKAVNRLSSSATSYTPISSNNTSTTGRRKWIPHSQRWRKEMEALANMEDSEVREVGGLIFVPNDRKFWIARIGQMEVLLGLKKDGTEVAIKKMLISNYNDFQNELKRLQEYRFHSCIVQCVHSEDDGDIGYIAMQLCDYNLEEYIKQQQPTEPERKQIVKEFLEGLKDFHEQTEVKLIHGDIKPQNILIDGDGGVRFADLGISRILKPGQTTRVTIRAGTECWEATEVLRNQKGDQDVWSKQSTDIQVAGMLVYYILSGGKHPFGDGIECPVRISKGDYELNDLNDEEAKDLVKSMLNLDPKARPPITEVLSHPYFWDERRKKSFLKEMGNVPEVQKYRESYKDESLKKVLKELEVDKKSFSMWKTQLAHVTDEDIKKKWFNIVYIMAKDDNIFPETLLSLLRFLRNHWKHQQDVMKEINVMKLFPDLVVTAYKLYKKRDWTCCTSIQKDVGRWKSIQQLQQDFSTGTTDQTVSGAGSGLTQGIHTLGLGSSKAVNRLSSAATFSTPIPSSNTSTTGRRKWIQRNQRWREQMEALANMEDSEVREVGGLIFVPNDEKFRIARTAQTEVLLGLKKDGTEVAIKKMLISNYNDFQNELKRLQGYRFHSLRVVQYMDSAEVSDIGYIAMELCDYNLEEYIKQQQPTEPERKRIVKEFLEGLKDLHEHPKVKLIHRDIKPQNILIDVDGAVKFADFGISRILEPGQTTMVTGRVGTECWEATEILNAEGHQDIRYNRSTDIQVAGMLVYYILSGGKHPFGDGIECPVKISKGDYKLNDLNDEEAKDLVKSMLNVDPEARPRITEILKHPYFWDESRKETFLKEVGDVPEVQRHKEFCKDESLKKVLKELEVDKKSFSTWKTQLHHVTDEDIKKKWLNIVEIMAKDDNTFPETLLCLLRFIRNRWRHGSMNTLDMLWQELMKEISVMKLFPDLVVTVYKLDEKRGWNINNILHGKQGFEYHQPTRKEFSSADEEAAAFVDRHREKLICSVRNVKPIADALRSKELVHPEKYSEIRAAATSEAKMREIYECLHSAGAEGKAAFYGVLLQEELHLVNDLKKRDDRL